MALKRFTLPPDDREVGEGDPPQDVNGIVDCITAYGSAFSIVNTSFAGGAPLDGVSDSTAAVQACMNAAAVYGAPVLIPGGVQFRVSQLTWNAGQVIQGVYSGTYPGESAITTASILTRLAGTNLDLIVVPDGANYGAIRDLAIDGNKNNNTAGIGVNIQDGAAGQECQITIERCFIHDNPGSNVYLGGNRRGNKVQFGCLNYSGAGDGVTVCGSDNLIMSNIIGSNYRAGINLGSTISQNWAAFGSNLNSTTTHVFNNDIYSNLVGIAVPASVTRSLIVGNGIDRNLRQGITVYNGDCNIITGNAFHSNGQAANNTYGHIDIGAAVVNAGISGNTFGPVDGGVTNLCSYCVVTQSGVPAGVITGDIGTFDASDTVGGLISTAGSNTSPSAYLSKGGGIVQGANSTQMAFQVRDYTSRILFSLSAAGSFTLSEGAGQFETPQNVFGSATPLASTVASFVSTGTGVKNLATRLYAGQTADIATFYASDGTTVLAEVLATGEFVTPAMSVTGLTGATAGSRLVGTIASGTAPVSGTFQTGDVIIVLTGGLIICTAGGTHGTWQPIGAGTVTSVAAGDTSIVVGGTGAAPTLETGTLDVIATDHPAAGDWSNNSHKITSLANGSSAADAAAYGQIPAADTTAANIKPAGTQTAGSNGKWADSGHIHPPGSSFLCTPTSYAPTTDMLLSTTSATLSAASGGNTPVAAGSNGGEISTIATWGATYGGNGVLAVSNATVFPAGGGTINVAASGPTTAVVTYTGISGNTLTGCAYVSGSPTGTVATGGTVTLTSAAISTGPFTAPASGSVIVTASFVFNGTSAQNTAFALAAHGAVSPVAGYVSGGDTNSITNDFLTSLPFLLTGLVPGNPYNYDLLFAIAGAGTLDIRCLGQTSTTPTGTAGMGAGPALMTVQAV